jgi:DNA-binding NarL/FixJ family response regulator
VVIVDDHEGFRTMARRLLEEDGFEVVGEAADGEAGYGAVEALRPQLVLLDVQLPDTDGFVLASRLAASHPETVVVLTSVRPAADYGDRLNDVAARGFVPKPQLSGSMLVEMVAGGG